MLCARQFNSKHAYITYLKPTLCKCTKTAEEYKHIKMTSSIYIGWWLCFTFFKKRSHVFLYAKKDA